ncbi:MAG TPA: hypothetical protein DCX23_04715, partial [Lachnospiraceae bacterium]|nr:hypothetical protein [Lachnospiraceae bacterium]
MVSGYYFFAGRMQRSEAYTYKQFAEALEEKKVDSVNIKPNAQGSAGRIVIFMKDGSSRQLYVTDVAKVDETLKGYEGVEVVVDDIPSDSSLMNSILLIVVAAAIFLIFFTLMNRQGGGTNAQMMNFGK